MTTFDGVKISQQIILKSLSKIKMRGRLEYIKKGEGKLRKYLNFKEDLCLDGAHSFTAAKNGSSYLKSLKKPIYGIWAMQKNRRL